MGEGSYYYPNFAVRETDTDTHSLRTRWKRIIEAELEFEIFWFLSLS